MNDDSSSSAGADSEQLRFTDEQFIWRFSPNQTDPELLEAIFVGREPLLQNVLEKIAEAATTGSTHNVLLYGPRGIGKSHFASLLHHRLLRDKELSETVHIAHLNEDETTTSMVQLLVRIYRSLCKAYPEAYSPAWLDELINQPTGEITEVLTRRLVARFDKRTMVILVENLNLLFENLGKDGQHELRTFLQEHPFACVIATSQQLFKAVNDRSEPFFGFFQQIPLKPLSLPDAQKLLAKIASAKGQDELAGFLNTPDGRGRVRAIHDLTGGNHRVYIVLSGFATRESLDQLVAPFQKMADDLTPYYQERLRWISPLQRQIVELLCREHRTLNPKEIARRLLGDQNSIGKQVRELTKIGYLTSTKRGRETFYELSEPLMRLAYEVKEQSLLEMLVEFLRIWYRQEELHKLLIEGAADTTQQYVNAALERSRSKPDPRLKLLDEELKAAKAEGRELELPTLLEEKAAASQAASDWFQAGLHHEDHLAAIGCYDEALELNSEDSSSWNNKGVALNGLRRYEEALVCLTKATEFGPKNDYAWNNRGISLYSLKRFAEAITCYEKSLQLNPKYASPWNGKGTSLDALGRHDEAIESYVQSLTLDPTEAYVWNNKGNTLHTLGRYAEAIECYDESLKLYAKVAYVWSNKGNSFRKIKRDEDAIECYSKSLELDSENADIWNSKGISLYNLVRYDESLDCYDKSISLAPKDANVWNNKGNVLHSSGRFEEAIECYEMSMAIDPKYSHPWNGKGNTLNSLGRYQEAITCLEESIRLEPENVFPWINKGNSLRRLERYEEAVVALEKALELDLKNASVCNTLGIVLCDNLAQYQKALTYYGKAIELDPGSVHARFNRSETFFALQRWDEGFDAIRDALAHSNGATDYLGDASSMFFLIFQLSEDNDLLLSRISSLVDLYDQAAEEQMRGTPGEVAHRGIDRTHIENETQQNSSAASPHSVRSATNPLSHLADGLVKSLGKIGAIDVAPETMEGFVAAVEHRVVRLSEFEIPLRLFRYGIRYLTSRRESEFVELIQPERRILRQALGLELEESTQ